MDSSQEVIPFYGEICIILFDLSLILKTILGKLF